MTRQTSDSKNRDGDTNITVLFGTDEHGKPRAAYFEAVDSELMTRAAAAMKLQLPVAMTMASHQPSFTFSSAITKSPTSMLSQFFGR
jgi:hypothetical protein